MPQMQAVSGRIEAAIERDRALRLPSKSPCIKRLHLCRYTTFRLMRKKHRIKRRIDQHQRLKQEICIFRGPDDQFSTRYLRVGIKNDRADGFHRPARTPFVQYSRESRPRNWAEELPLAETSASVRGICFREYRARRSDWIVLRKVGLLQGWFKDVFSGSREQI